MARRDDLNLRGELQAELMHIVWRLGEVTVDDVRAAQPSRARCAYTTIRAAERELRFHLERDADQVVVRELHDPLSLASAICKAAGAEPSSTLTSLGGHGRVSLRLEELVEGSARRSPPVERGARMLATGLAVAILGLLLVGPAWALGRDGGPSAERSHACSHSR